MKRNLNARSRTPPRNGPGGESLHHRPPLPSRPRRSGRFIIMKGPITYGKLQHLLHRLGFQETVVPGSHVVYAGREPGLLLYPLYQPEATVSWADVAKTRRFLVEWGFTKE